MCAGLREAAWDTALKLNNYFSVIIYRALRIKHDFKSCFSITAYFENDVFNFIEIFSVSIFWGRRNSISQPVQSPAHYRSVHTTLNSSTFNHHQRTEFSRPYRCTDKNPHPFFCPTTPRPHTLFAVMLVRSEVHENTVPRPTS